MEKADSMKKLDEQIEKCKLCRLWESRTNAVPGFGNIEDVEVVFVGEGPGRNEDLQGKPFVGAGGKLLDELLANAGMKREQVYITNIVKCRPPKNRKPKPDEAETCTSNYLEKQLDLLNPKLVCTLGATAMEYFIGETKMGENHGKLAKSEKIGIPILPTYHPASIFHNRSLRGLLQNDLRKIPEILKTMENGKSE
jgi:uracil-DNA glycosylase